MFQVERLSHGSVQASSESKPRSTKQPSAGSIRMMTAPQARTLPSSWVSLVEQISRCIPASIEESYGCESSPSGP